VVLAWTMQEAPRPTTQRLGAPENAMFKSFLGEQRGTTAIEYGLIAALIAGANIVALTHLGDSLSSSFSEVSGAVMGAI
jgi:pilus assembly protein Flp/PilA